MRNLLHLDRLAAWFLAEGYGGSHLFVAVKGVTEPIFRKFAEGRWHSAVKAGRMSLRLFPEKNTGSDLLDACRDLDADDYDLFLMLGETEACEAEEQDELCRLMEGYGRKNMAPFINMELDSSLLVHASGCRSGKADAQARMRRERRMFFRNEEAEWEQVLELWHPCWQDRFRLAGSEGWREANGDHAAILKFTGEVLRIKWDRWGMERFVRDKDGIFRLERD